MGLHWLYNTSLNSRTSGFLSLSFSLHNFNTSRTKQTSELLQCSLLPLLRSCPHKTTLHHTDRPSSHTTANMCRTRYIYECGHRRDEKNGSCGFDTIWRKALLAEKRHKITKVRKDRLCRACRSNTDEKTADRASKTAKKHREDHHKRRDTGGKRNREARNEEPNIRPSVEERHRTPPVPPVPIDDGYRSRHKSGQSGRSQNSRRRMTEDAPERQDEHIQDEDPWNIPRPEAPGPYTERVEDWVYSTDDPSTIGFVGATAANVLDESTGKIYGEEKEQEPFLPARAFWPKPQRRSNPDGPTQGPVNVHPRPASSVYSARPGFRRDAEDSIANGQGRYDDGQSAVGTIWETEYRVDSDDEAPPVPAIPSGFVDPYDTTKTSQNDPFYFDLKSLVGSETAARVLGDETENDQWPTADNSWPEPLVIPADRRSMTTNTEIGYFRDLRIEHNRKMKNYIPPEERARMERENSRKMEQIKEEWRANARRVSNETEMMAQTQGSSLSRSVTDETAPTSYNTTPVKRNRATATQADLEYPRKYNLAGALRDPRYHGRMNPGINPTPSSCGSQVYSHPRKPPVVPQAPIPEEQKQKQDHRTTVETTWSQILPRDPKYDLGTARGPLPMVRPKDIRRYEREETAKKKAEKAETKKKGKSDKKPAVFGQGFLNALGMSRHEPSLESFACAEATRHDSLHSQSTQCSHKSGRSSNKSHKSSHSNKRR
ncbi:uncharacterized protein F5Z01DRAFT_73125 [Emericellopsis atlantica]|uniref:Uncharacterized protein n=1 Tax=Emericellopsis atlantica TaxID=2614577 RepID=A0A9P8CQ92_9HYPO|nr:uncharacterized protein F5Z01DRAFT_73125 [Emericellopsis atlantica]KAG9255072.1 hypothetical protein F5Z01DRAFT_73125 [Emericellopsis atlantica]